MPTKKNHESTRRSTILARLSDYCGMVLAPDRVDSLLKDLVETMTHGPTAWAFRTEDAGADLRESIAKGLEALSSELNALINPRVKHPMSTIAGCKASMCREIAARIRAGEWG